MTSLDRIPNTELILLCLIPAQVFLSIFLCFFFALIAWVPIHPFLEGHIGQETDVPAIYSFAIDRPNLTPNEYNDLSKTGLISAQQTQSMSLFQLCKLQRKMFGSMFQNLMSCRELSALAITV